MPQVIRVKNCALCGRLARDRLCKKHMARWEKDIKKLAAEVATKPYNPSIA